MSISFVCGKYKIGGSAESVYTGVLKKDFTIENVIDKNNAPKIGDTKFLVKKGSDMLPSSIVAAYEAEETINGRRIVGTPLGTNNFK